MWDWAETKIIVQTFYFPFSNCSSVMDESCGFWVVLSSSYWTSTLSPFKPTTPWAPQDQDARCRALIVFDFVKTRCTLHILQHLSVAYRQWRSFLVEWTVHWYLLYALCQFFFNDLVPDITGAIYIKLSFIGPETYRDRGAMRKDQLCCFHRMA